MDKVCPILAVNEAVIPVLNEAENRREDATTFAASNSATAVKAELIVVDGGSQDATVQGAQPLADCVLASPAGRAMQMNAGANIAKGSTSFFYMLIPICLTPHW